MTSAAVPARAALALIAALFCGLSHAQTYPSKPVRIVVPFPPGGTNDVVARIIARDLSEAMGHQFIVDNRGGGSGVIGGEAVAKAPPDGYTLMVHSTTHIANAFVMKKLPYDTFNDFQPICLLTSQPAVLVVHPSLPVKNVKEFVALAKSRPNQITYASNGEGGNLHVLMALFASMANIQVLHVPYKGGAQMSTSLMSGETQSGMPTIGAVMPHLRSNRLRPLGVASATRSTMLPNVPPIAQSGVPGYDMNPWIGAFAPAKTPRAITDRLYGEIQRILKKPEISKALVEQGLEPWPASQDEFVKRLRSDYEKYQKVFKIIGTPAAS